MKKTCNKCKGTGRYTRRHPRGGAGCYNLPCTRCDGTGQMNRKEKKK